MCKFTWISKFWFSYFGVVCLGTFCAGEFVYDGNPYRHRHVLDPKGKYVLEWTVDWVESQVIFNVTVETHGYVGFGLSTRGLMSDADIVIGGVLPNGSPYFSDKHTNGNRMLEVDPSQDWKLIGAAEDYKYTRLMFSRLFNTCDEFDMVITGEYLNLIWAYSETDADKYHFEYRGSFRTYLLDAEITPRSLIKSGVRTKPSSYLGDWKIWSIVKSQPMPVMDTTYFCYMFQGPRHFSRRHIVGFNPIFVNGGVHVHHFLLYRCHAPPGQKGRDAYGEFLDGPGELCYRFRERNINMPTYQCQDFLYVYARGGGAVFFPEHVGIPTSLEPDEFYMLQVHYDNPGLLSNVEVNFEIEVFHTDKLRMYDADILNIGQQFPSTPTIMVPPNSLEHVIYGHCGTECTKRLLPSGGIRVFATLMHTHLAGRGGRIMHVRGNTELPAISYDDNYDNGYQRIRLLKEERVIMPGDMLMQRCVYDTTDRNGSVTVGGLATTKEMCDAMLWYYPKIPGTFQLCRSEIRSRAYGEFVGILNYTWSQPDVDFVVNSPPQNQGVLMNQVGNNIEWTNAKRAQLQKFQQFSHQVNVCPKLDEIMETFYDRVGPQPPPDRRILLEKAAKIGFSRIEDEIVEPGFEYFSVYPKNLVPYHRTNVCYLRSIASWYNYLKII